MFSSSKPRFDANKTKVQLKMLINRLNLLTSKKANLAKAEKRKVAMLLREDKEHNAHILVEQIIREDYTLEAYDLLKQYTEMLLARFNVVVTEEELKPEVADAVCALVYSGWLMGSEIKELQVLFKLFTAKYGAAYTQEVLDGKEKYINARLLKILSSTQVPDPSVIEAYLTEIARTYGVEYIAKPLASIQPTSATLGIALPTPGMPMPAPPEPLDVSEFGGGEVGEAAGGAGGAAAAGSSQPALPIAVELPPSARPVVNAQPVVSAQPVVGAVTPTPGVPTPYTAVLTKSSTLGFGLILDGGNLVTGLRPGSEAEALAVPGAGRIVPGDRVLALNGTPVSVELPAKSVAADLDEGAQGIFTMLRIPELQQQIAYAPTPLPGTSTSSGEPPQMPPTAPPVSTPIATPVAETPPPPAANIYPPTDADDLLARRLEALKRG